MKKFILIVCALSFSTCLLSQERFKKAYWIPEKIIYKNSTSLELQEKIEKKYSQLNILDKYEKKLKEKIDSILPLGKEITIEKKSDNNTDLVYYEKLTLDQKMINKMKFTYSKSTSDNVKRGSVKLEEDKLFVNAWLSKKIENNKKQTEKVNRKNKSTPKIDSSTEDFTFKNNNGIFEKTKNTKEKDKKEDKWSRKTYYFKLENRQSITLKYDEFFISAIIIPLKYRFRDDDKENQDFSSSFNINAFIGYSIGWTKFMYRKDIENLERDQRVLLGPFLGSSVIELNNSNTLNLTESEKYNRGVISYGVGIGYAYGKFQMTLLYGWESAVGSKSKDWTFNNQPWIGAGLGFELIK
ncbi:hypothetical protein [Formosa sp. A9]|uniref:hypothetical protein n=1 Tax=Formosa sp. A9 TaxID=3442641 RepID=UPI003EBA67C9